MLTDSRMLLIYKMNSFFIAFIYVVVVVVYKLGNESDLTILNIHCCTVPKAFDNKRIATSTKLYQQFHQDYVT